MNVGIIGCGKMGFKRAKALSKDKLIGVFDINKEAMAKMGGKQFSSWQALLRDKEIEAVIISVYHKLSPKIVLAALKAGKNVLVEKPLGNNAKEAKKIFQMGKVLKVGFNHRFHPAILKAYKMKKKIGKILYIRSVYGHGGRKNYDLEWRLQPKFTKGGELYDQGSHIIDLAQWFVGEFKQIFAVTKNYYWKKTPLEDNAFCQLISKTGQIVSFQVSLTQWKNKFSFEIYGDKGYLLINGLGGNYGEETLRYGTKVGLGQVPKEQIWRFTKDNSWVLEWQEFKQAIKQKRTVMSSAKENWRLMKIMDGLYKSAKLKKIVTI